MFLSEGREFPSAPCLARKKKILNKSSRLNVAEIARVAWHASFQPLEQEETCNSAHEQTPLSNDIGKYVGLRTYQHPHLEHELQTVLTISKRWVIFSQFILSRATRKLFEKIIASVEQSCFKDISSLSSGQDIANVWRNSKLLYLFSKLATLCEINSVYSLISCSFSVLFVLILYSLSTLRSS